MGRCNVLARAARLPALTVLCTLWHIRYPGIVRDVPFCAKPYGCAFDEILTDPHAVYIKLDDDIIFIKDGSFEHLVYQVSAVCGGGGNPKSQFATI